MEIELEEMKKDGYDMYTKVKKKLSDTIPLTVTIPKCAMDKFNYYCKELGVKKSHMIKLAVIIFIEDLHRDLEKDIEELMNTTKI